MRTATLLIVDDDDVDAETIQRSLRREKIANPLRRAVDGEEALALLRASGQDALSGPVLVLLDLNMPRLDGIGFLRALRADPALHSTVVFVLTTSDDERDRAAAYQSHAAGYIMKERAGTDFVEVVSMLRSYWKIVELP